MNVSPRPSPARPSARGSLALVPVVSALTLTVTAVNFLAPLLTVITGEFGVSLAEAGGLVVATTLTWAAGAPFAGLISDRFGRRPIILVALCGMGLTTLAGAFVTDFWWLAVLRVLTGAFGSGGPPTLMATVADLFPPHKRGMAIGWANLSFSFALAATVPALGVVGGLWGWRAAFIVIGVALLLVAVLVRLLLPGGQLGGGGAGNPILAYRHVAHLPGLPALLASNILERFTFMVLMLYFAAFLIGSYGLNPATVAPALTLTAVGMIAGTLTGGYLADRFSKRLVAAISLAAAGIFGLVVFVVPLHLVLSVAAGFGFGFADAAGRPAFVTLLFGLSDKHRGALVGVVAATNQLGFAIGAAVGGLVIGLAGFPGIGVTLLVLALVGAGLVLVARQAPRPAAVAETSGPSAVPPAPGPRAARPVHTAPSTDQRADLAGQAVPRQATLSPAVPVPGVSPLDLSLGERRLATRLTAQSRRTADPALAEVLAVAAGRCRDRAFRLERWSGAGATRPAPETGEPETAIADLAFLRQVLTAPSLYDVPAPGGTLSPDRWHWLRANEAEARAWLAGARDRLLREDGVRRVALGPAVAANAGCWQSLAGTTADAPRLHWLSLPPGGEAPVQAGAGGGLIVPLHGEGVCRIRDGTVGLCAGSVVALDEGATAGPRATNDWPLFLLLIGAFEPAEPAVAGRPARPAERHSGAR